MYSPRTGITYTNGREENYGAVTSCLQLDGAEGTEHEFIQVSGLFCLI